jgi:4-amino-4-deoxy-L-arabinose transferase-like glycosyltransferase
VGPGFPLLLYLCYLPVKNIPETQQILGVIQVIFGSLSLLLSYAIGRNFFSPWTGLIAMALLAFYQPLVFIQNYTLTESLYIFLVAISVYLLSRWDLASGTRRQTLWCSAAIGLFIALQTLVRPPSILFIAIPFGIAFYKIYIGAERWKVMQACGLLLLGFCLTLSPWVVRNYMTFSKVIFTSTGSIDPLLFGAFPQREDYLAALKKLQKHLSQRPPGSDALTFSKQFVREQIQQQFRSNFWAACKWYVFEKFRLLWFMPYTAGLKFAKLATITYHRWLFGMGVLGFILQTLFVRRLPWFILGSHLFCVSLVYQMYAADPRYALPFMPLVAVFASSAWTLMIVWIKKAFIPKLRKG